ncbi:hypothetical protein Tco_1032549 [Tanacetum coccineum]|uniref:Uncharacterized protein n=1 Tax=Tanacetum coccineum TaxID=301880 RepID=A0ABQ5GD76_9ASTR
MCLIPIGGSGILAAVNDEVPGTRSKLVIGTDEASRRTCGKHLWRASLALSENRGFQGMEMTKIPLGDRYVEWCNVSPITGTSSQESNNLRPRDYTFREWTLIKVVHTDISEPVKKALLKFWLIDYFQDESGIIKNPLSRSFHDYKWVFDLEIDQLANEYELGLGKKGHMLDKIWEYYKDVHRDSTYWWHDHGFEEEEHDEMGIEIEKYDPPDVQVETFEVKKYSFKSGQSFVCVTKDLDDSLPLGRKNRSRFKEMIRNEFDAHDAT